MNKEDLGEVLCSWGDIDLGSYTQAAGGSGGQGGCGGSGGCGGGGGCSGGSGGSGGNAITEKKVSNVK